MVEAPVILLCLSLFIDNAVNDKDLLNKTISLLKLDIR